MKQFAIIGLAPFGIRMLEQLSLITRDIIIIDKNPDVINLYKDLAREAFIMDAVNEKVLYKIIPPEIDAAILDLGSSLEAAIMITNYLKKLQVKEIIVKADNDQQGDVLKIVGATKVVFPDQETAKSLTPLLASASLFKYMPVSTSLVMAELLIPPDLAGKTAREANVRKNYGINIIAIRHENEKEFQMLPHADYVFLPDDVILVAGIPSKIQALVAEGEVEHASGLRNFFKFMFSSRL